MPGGMGRGPGGHSSFQGRRIEVRFGPARDDFEVAGY